MEFCSAPVAVGKAAELKVLHKHAPYAVAAVDHGERADDVGVAEQEHDEGLQIDGLLVLGAAGDGHFQRHRQVSLVHRAPAARGQRLPLQGVIRCLNCSIGAVRNALCWMVLFMHCADLTCERVHRRNANRHKCGSTLMISSSLTDLGDY